VADQRRATVVRVRGSLEEAPPLDLLHHLAGRLTRDAQPARELDQPRALRVDVAEHADVRPLHAPVAQGVEPVDELVGLRLGDPDEEPQEHRLAVRTDLVGGHRPEVGHAGSLPD
jgi:hypothetical protein